MSLLKSVLLCSAICFAASATEVRSLVTLPLQFEEGDDAATLQLNGTEIYHIEGLENGAHEVTVVATAPQGTVRRFTARVRIDTPKEWDYYAHGGILPYVLRQLAA